MYCIVMWNCQVQPKVVGAPIRRDLDVSPDESEDLSAVLPAHSEVTCILVDFTVFCIFNAVII